MEIDASSASPAITRSWLVRVLIWRVSGVSCPLSTCSIPEMWPTSVDMPVEVTTICPDPRVTLVFMNAMSWRSPSGASGATASTPFDDGRLSPVSAASSISSVAAAMIRPSAEMRSPASNDTTSPGTSSSAGISASSPSRRTRDLTIIIFWSAATASAALPSWLRPR